MGVNELEPKPAGVWPLAEQPRVPKALEPTAAHGYGVASGSEFNLSLLWQIVWMWRWLILGAAGVGVAGAVVLTLLMTPLYRSSAVIELNPPVVEVMEGESRQQMSANDRQFLQTQYGLLRSRALAERVSQDLNLASNADLAPEEANRAARQRLVVDVLSEGLTVEAQPESRLVNISFSSEDPQIAARVVNGFAESFINSSLERRYQASSYARDFLQRQIGVVRQELENSERQLVAYAQQQGIIRTGGSSEGATTGGAGGNPTTESLNFLNELLAAATARRVAAEQRYRQMAGQTNTAEIAERTSALRGQLAMLQAEYQEKSQIFQPDYPDMVRLRSRIESVEQAIRAEAGTTQASRAGTLRGEYLAALNEERGLQQRVNQLRGAVLNERGRSIQYNILQRDVDTNRALYEALLQRYKEIGVAGGIGQSQASIVDRGQVPASPYRPNLFLNLLIGLGLGLVIGTAIAFLLEVLNDTIKTPEDVREKLRLSFLGGIPVAKTKAVDDLREGGSALGEAYFSATTSLQFTTDAGTPKVLLVTSTRQAEGKSTSSWALAVSFARLGKRVLLIDADMRKPAFVTGEEKQDGLANLLTNRDPLKDHLVKVEQDGIWLLPCGPLPPNPAELLASPRLRTILAEASAQFDQVIVDSPPILGLADTPLLSSLASGTLLVIEAGKTRTRAASEALGRLRQAGGNVVGALLTRYKHNAAGYGYSYEPYRYEGVEGRERQIRLIVQRHG